MTKYPFANNLIAGGVLLIFCVVNIVSVAGMGKIEDVLVYVKLALLLFISIVIFTVENPPDLALGYQTSGSLFDILIVASVTFVAYEGFQMVIHAYGEVGDPQKNVPRAIYTGIISATIIYVFLTLATVYSIPQKVLVENQEFALASGAQKVLGSIGQVIVVFSALLATSSAINDTLFGASRLVSVIADDGNMPQLLARRKKHHIPVFAIALLGVMAYILILTGSLKSILEFGSITFILVSFAMSLANLEQYKFTKANPYLAGFSTLVLLVSALLILRFEWHENPLQLLIILIVYTIIILASFAYKKLSSINNVKSTINGND